MALKTQAKDRKARYESVVESILDQSDFSASDAASYCSEKSEAFVSTILKQLAEDGILECCEFASGNRYQWAKNPEGFDAESWIERRVQGMPIRETPNEERPRERLLRLGAEQLKTSELLAILIRTGRQGESAVEAGQRIANHFADRLDRMRELSRFEYREISSVVSEGVYCQILAGIELGRRVAEASEARKRWKDPIDSVQVAKEYCRIQFRRLAIDAKQEEFHIVTLDVKLRPISNYRITIGTLDASLVAAREVFRPAIRDSSSAILLVHNHPSGDPTPSQQDFDVTNRLESAGKILGIQVVDHIVVALQGEASIRELL